jgi:hypothetical protein
MNVKHLSFTHKPYSTVMQVLSRYKLIRVWNHRSNRRSNRYLQPCTQSAGSRWFGNDSEARVSAFGVFFFVKCAEHSLATLQLLKYQVALQCTKINRRFIAHADTVVRFGFIWRCLLWKTSYSPEQHESVRSTAERRTGKGFVSRIEIDAIFAYFQAMAGPPQPRKVLESARFFRNKTSKEDFFLVFTSISFVEIYRELLELHEHKYADHIYFVNS